MITDHKLLDWLQLALFLICQFLKKAYSIHFDYESLEKYTFSHIIDVVCGLGTSCEIYLGLTRER